MRQMKSALYLIVLCVLLVSAGVVSAQDSVAVPDLTGLNVPQAAALLNRSDLKLGTEDNIAWTAESGLPQNTVGGQSAVPGESLARGSVVNVTVLRSPNTILLYDDNDLTLVNNTGGDLDLNSLFFSALDGNSAALAGSRWSQTLRAGQCVQVWSVGRNGPKGLDECPLIQNWLVTTNGGEHFWTGAGGTTRFNISQNGVERAQCQVAVPGRCEFYLASGGSGGDVTEFVYFAYTNDRLAIINTSEDKWMPLAGFQVLNNFVPSTPGAPVPVGDPSIFGSPDVIGRIDQLAPGQCLFFTNSVPTAEEPPRPCDVVARMNIGTDFIFWGAEFGIDSLTDDVARVCPAATTDALTLCIMPR